MLHVVPATKGLPDLQIGAFRKITIMDCTPHGDVIQDWQWGETHPIGGSETATMNIATSLHKCGHEVEVVTDWAGIRNHQCDIFIANRRWGLFQEGIRPGRLNYLWCHNDVNEINPGPLSDPSVAEVVYANCDGVIFLSHYQQRRWIKKLNVPLSKVFLSSNGIPLKKFQGSPENLASRPPWAYYASTPDRGLKLLLAGWPIIKSAVKDAQLHIFSSMKVYNETDREQFVKLYEMAKSLDGVHYHGAVGQAQLRKMSQMCRVLAYPCIVPETSCISAMEAMAAGCVVASTSLGAMPETAWHNPLIPIADGWLEQWVLSVVRVLLDNRYYERLAGQNLVSASYYDWDAVAARWLERFELDMVK
jgi:glycosyltransferase involved in cell wall biosynthesis